MIITLSPIGPNGITDYYPTYSNGRINFEINASTNGFLYTETIDLDRVDWRQPKANSKRVIISSIRYKGLSNTSKLRELLQYKYHVILAFKGKRGLRIWP